MPNGVTLDFYVAVSVVDTFRVDGALMARVTFESDTDRARLAGALDMSEDSLTVLAGAPGAEVAVATPAGNSSRSSMQMVFEVETLLIQAEYSKSETRLTVSGPDGQPHTVVMTESQQKDFTYGSSEGDE